MVWKSSCVVKSQTGCNQAMEYSKHSKTCSIITACGICPLCLEAKKKYMDSGPSPRSHCWKKGQLLHLFVPTLCTISENTNDEDGHLLANGTSNTVGHVVFHGKKQQKIRQFQLTFGGCCLLSSVCPISV